MSVTIIHGNKTFFLKESQFVFFLCSFQGIFRQSLIQINGYLRLLAEVDSIRQIKYSSDNTEHEKKLMQVNYCILSLDYKFFKYITFWAGAWQNQQNDLYTQGRLGSAWAFWSVFTWHCMSSQGAWHCMCSQGPYASTVYQRMITLHGCADWSESSLGTQVIL